jgi:glycosyltransferase involved in cell wall biosynthesis
MFEYLMAEVPVIVSNLPEMKKLVLDYDVGVISSENSIIGLKEAIEKAIKLDKIAVNDNIQKVKESYNWEEQEKVLLKVYNEL